MSVSAEGSSSARSSLDHSSSQGRSSLDGCHSASDASDRSERCAAPAALRAESMPQPLPHQYPAAAHPGGHASAAATAGSHPSNASFESSRGGGGLGRHGAAFMDADCCGDSGCPMVLPRHVVAATRAASLPAEQYPDGGLPLHGSGCSSDALAALLNKEVRTCSFCFSRAWCLADAL